MGGFSKISSAIKKCFQTQKIILGDKLDDNSEGPVKYYLVMTTFTCGDENFLDIDGRSFGPIEAQ